MSYLLWAKHVPLIAKVQTAKHNRNFFIVLNFKLIIIGCMYCYIFDNVIVTSMVLPRTPSTVFRFGLYPSFCTDSVYCWVCKSENVNRPELSVIVLRLVGIMVTDAPLIGEESLLSMITPDILVYIVKSSSVEHEVLRISEVVKNITHNKNRV